MAAPTTARYGHGTCPVCDRHTGSLPTAMVNVSGTAPTSGK